MSKIIRYCKLVEDHVGPNAFDVSRCGVLGNPYTHIKDKTTKAKIVVKTREEAIEMYKEYFRRMMASTDRKAKPFQDAFYQIVKAYREYDEVYIGCYCKLNESCHGDFIIEEVIKYAVREKLKKYKKK
jgi:hypothetical protein